MAKKVTNPSQSAPAVDRAARDGSPLLVVLTVILILIGIIDVVLWGVVGYYALQGTQQSVPPNGAADGGEPAASNGEPASDGEASDSAEKREALMAYIQELAEIEPLEAEVMESFASVSGTNYTDDDTMYAEITERTLPLCQQMNEKVLEIVSGDPEIEELCKMHRDYVTKWLNALGTLASALSNQDTAQATEANNQINAANDLAADFQQAVRSLAEERNVTLNN